MVSLDRAMAMELGPLSQAFLGEVVRSEGEAVRGKDRSSRVYHLDRAAGAAEAVGTCGSHALCGLAAPLACYTCVNFQPWMEAPHEGVLSALLERREAPGDRA